MIGTYVETLSDILLGNLDTERRILRSGKKNLVKVDKIRKKAINDFMTVFPEET